MEFYNINELVTLVLNTAIGSAAFVAFQVSVKKKPLTLGFVIGTFILSLFVGNITFELLGVMEVKQWRTIGVSCAAFLAIYILEYIEEERTSLFTKLFDSFIDYLSRFRSKRDDDYY